MIEKKSGGAREEVAVRVTDMVEVDVPCVIAFMFEEGVHVIHSVLSKHVHDDFSSLVYACVSVWSLVLPCCPGMTPVVWVFPDCGDKVGSYDD
jgi:hypothetical protein